MTSTEIRQSFLDFFQSQGHEIVPSASLMPSAPNLLFTNAGMNQFVPYFLGERTPSSRRLADTQKCIRAGGKHNDLDDVGFDTYHHTFFEMLGNWSIGDYFKKEALEWSWELLTKVWGFPKERLYATVYKPGDGDPASFDEEAYGVWKGIFEGAGLDPEKHIHFGGKKDNFWMMGDTGPCGPCSEIHMDLRAENPDGSMVNADSPWCIELWNNVFIQFNAKEDGSFEPLKEKHVDTGMGFERIAGIMATTKEFKDFSRPPSNYDSDLFGDIFKVIGDMCGQSYGATLPQARKELTDAEMRDVVFRVLADHIRTLSCAIADGILPGNDGRNYVLRRILRRAVMYGRRLKLEAGFFTKLVAPTVNKLGPIFPELKTQQEVITKVIQAEESAFDRTIDRGMQLLERIFATNPEQISGTDAFTLYDTYGFPLDLTQIIAEERGLSVDVAGFNSEMEQQRERARAAQKKEVIDVVDADAAHATPFKGFEEAACVSFATKVEDVLVHDDKCYFVFAETPFYAEMGGQLGDTGYAEINGKEYAIGNTIKDGAGRHLHEVAGACTGLVGQQAYLSVDMGRRRAIQRNHSATHILHHALRKVLGTHVRQAGSLVTPERLRFDFAHYEQPTKEQLQEIEAIANRLILANDSVQWYEVAFDDKPEDCIAFFGEKYGNVVRVVDMGGWSKELCGGTHVKATGEIGLLKIVGESAISAGTRRIEAVVGESAFTLVQEQYQLLHSLAAKLSCKPEQIEERLNHQLETHKKLEKELKALQQKGAANEAEELAGSALSKGDLKVVAAVVKSGDANAMRALAVQVSKALDGGLVVLAGVNEGKGSLLCMASEAAIAAGYKSGDIVRELTGKLGGRGGGKPDFAMGGFSGDEDVKTVLNSFKTQFS
ncbi:MAG: alanine--tRNA ligase [Opitutales bacterium]|nr:alanine--tRNA ligase [Opitutales bacterium]